MPKRVLTAGEKEDVIRRFKRGDTIGLISFALNCDKKLISQALHAEGFAQTLRRRTRTNSVAWAWKGGVRE